MWCKLEYLPCIPTRGTEVPSGPDWFHEIKHDGYRLIVQREGKRVRLVTRRGYDWSDHYPLIVQAALVRFILKGHKLGVGKRTDSVGVPRISTASQLDGRLRSARSSAPHSQLRNPGRLPL